MKNEFSQDPQSESSATEIKKSLREAGQKIKGKSKEAASQFKEQGGKYFEQNKARAADCMGRFSDSLRSTAARFEAEEDPNLAHYTRLAAGKIDNAAMYVRDQDFSTLRRDTEDLARQHPVLFYGGMFTLGLAAARFLKASAEGLDESEEEQILEESSMMTGAVE